MMIILHVCPWCHILSNLNIIISSGLRAINFIPDRIGRRTILEEMEETCVSNQYRWLILIYTP
jgi:hypothetical protein